MRHWTKEEIALLQTIKHKTDFDLIALKTGRTRYSVKIKANRIGVFAYSDLEEWHDNIPLEIKAYLSGHFDGEGCIRLSKKYSGNLRHQLTIAVSSANKPSLELYQKHFNGKIRDKKHFTNKPMFIWQIRKQEDVFNFIESVLPFSIEKKDQLLLGKEWIEKRQNEAKTVKLSNDFLLFSEMAADKFKQLKKL